MIIHPKPLHLLSQWQEDKNKSIQVKEDERKQRRAIPIIIQWICLSGRRKKNMKENRDTTNTHHIHPLNKPNVRGFKLLAIEESETQHNN